MKEEIFHNRVVEFGIGAIDENTIDFIKYSGSFFLSACASATSDSGGDKASVVQAKQSDVQDTEMTQASETEPDQIKTEGH